MCKPDLESDRQRLGAQTKVTRPTCTRHESTDHGRLIFIHHQCLEVLPFCRFQRQQCIKIRVLRAQDFYTPLALKTATGQHLPALVVYKNQSPRSESKLNNHTRHIVKDRRTTQGMHKTEDRNYRMPCQSRRPKRGRAITTDADIWSHDADMKADNTHTRFSSGAHYRLRLQTFKHL